MNAMTFRQRFALERPCARASDVVQDDRHFAWRGNWSTLLSINK